jgi:hypothetical protein
VHGLNVIPSIQAQFGNWGVSIYGVAQTGFIVFSGSSLTSLAKVNIPNTINDVSNDLLNILNQLVTPLLTPNGQDLAGTDVIPVAVAVSYIDIVAAAGYAYPITKDMSVGANLKILNRRFSSKAVSPFNYDNILSEVRKDFDRSITGVTLDLGGVYQFPKLGTRVGMTLQNIIPVKSIRSDLTITDFGQDQNGNTVQIPVILPFEMTVPIILSAGAVHPLTENWDVALDWVDIANQDVKMDVYGDRLRIGTEYRLDVTKDKFGVALRAGLAERRVTAGLGLNIFRVLQIDGAYAHDVYTDQFAWFGQLKLGW